MVGRRRFLNVASAMGVSATSLALGSQEGIASAVDDPQEEVPYVSWMNIVRNNEMEPIGREPHYKTIDREEWADLKTTKKAASLINKKLKSRFRDSDFIKAGYTQSDASPTGFAVEVVYKTKVYRDGQTSSPETPLDDVKEVVPSTMGAKVGKNQWKERREGIPVNVESRTEKQAGYEDDWEQIPAACAINDDADPEFPPASSTAYFYGFDNDTYYLMTAGHVAGDSSESWGNPDKSNDDGIVHRSYNSRTRPDRDYALLYPYSSTGIEYKIREPDQKSVDYRIDGSYTDEGIEQHLIAGNKDVTFQGATTGRTTTNVIDFHENREDSNIDQYVETAYQAEDGDSGGIVFRDIGDDDGVKIVGTIMSYGPNGSEVQTAEAMENGYNGFFV